MRGVGEASVFGAAALALHAGALALWPPSGAVGEGSATSPITIAAASPEVAAIAAAWRAGPEAADATDVPTPPRDDVPPAPAISSAAATLAPGMPPGQPSELPDAPDEASPDRSAAALAPLPRAASAADRAPMLAPVAASSGAGIARVPEAPSPDARAPDGIAAPFREAAAGAPPDAPSPPSVTVAITAPPDSAPSVPVETSSDFRSSVPRPTDGRPLFGARAPLAVPERTLPPDLITAPPGSDLAPLASLRPAAMPDRPSSPPVRAAGAQSAAREATRATASGTGSKSGMGRRADAGTPAASAGAARSRQAAAPAGPSAETLRAQWGAQVKAHVAGRAAPPRGVRGRVGLVVSVATDGRVAGVGIGRSSGDARADRAAAAAVQRVGRVPRAPGGLPAGTYRFAVTLTLR